jgi:putative flavoprotein involved in K+ transport
VKQADVVVIGGGQAGLAMSSVLGERGVEHVVLERGRVGERWRSERWDSLRLLTPRWQSRLPGFVYRGPDADGFMTRDEVVRYLADYAASSGAPVEEGAAVTAVDRDGAGFRVETVRGTWWTGSVVIATGHCHHAAVPAWAERLPAGIVQVVPTRYRNPGQLPRGGVLVVGASATGIQLAAEVHRSGRPVTLAVSRHGRAPRRYRGRDLLWWYDAAGIGEDRAEQVADLEAVRRSPSLQLVGTLEHRDLDLGVLRAEGVRIVGRALGVAGGRLQLGGELAAHVAAAEERLALLLARIDRWIEQAGVPAPPPEPIRPVALEPAPASLDLAAEGIRTVLWATGFRRSYPWLRVPVLDAHGEVRHQGGVTPVPGLYVLGLPFLRRRKSSWLDGVGDDARDLAGRIAARRGRRAA